jgi:hypothetical protein
MRQILLGFDASLHFVKLPSSIECGNRGALKDYGTLITPPFQVLVDNLKPKATCSKSKSPAFRPTASTIWTGGVQQARDGRF